MGGGGPREGAHGAEQSPSDGAECNRRRGGRDAQRSAEAAVAGGHVLDTPVQLRLPSNALATSVGILCALGVRPGAVQHGPQEGEESYASTHQRK